MPADGNRVYLTITRIFIEPALPCGRYADLESRFAPIPLRCRRWLAVIHSMIRRYP